MFSTMRAFSSITLSSLIIVCIAAPTSRLTLPRFFDSSITVVGKTKDDYLGSTIGMSSSKASSWIRKRWSNKRAKYPSPVRIELLSRKHQARNRKTPPNDLLTVSFRQQGLSGSRCSSSDECQGERTCQQGIFEATRCAFPDAGFIRCSKPSDCVEQGEVCLTNDRLNLSICLSEDFAEEAGVTVEDDDRLPGTNPPSTSDQSATENQPSITNVGEGGNNNDPCISVDSLQHLSRQELVFEKDLLSNVLCDKNNSCATAGHMVTYRGNSMMMKSYCEAIGGCMKRVMLVNSPRYRMKLEIPSKSEDLVFNALSARYTTRAEEHLLSAIIRMGL